MTRFFVALADGCNIGYPVEGKVKRDSLLTLLPKQLTENVLISLSYRHELHTRKGQHHGIHEQGWSIKRLFADCGAFQYKELSDPAFKDGTKVTAKSAMLRYERRHLQDSQQYEEILLCSPDHIVDKKCSRKIGNERVDFTLQQAKEFFDLCKAHKHVCPVGVVHGKTLKQRHEMLDAYIEIGYTYIALGGMVQFSSRKKKGLNIVAGITNMEHPKIKKGSLLGKCRSNGIRMHILGLNSPEWQRWWIRLGIDSVDGSKVSSEGGINGWYWMQNDELSWDEDNGPKTATDLYSRYQTKKFGFDEWKWSDEELSQPIIPEDIAKITSCDCLACTFLRKHPCQSKVCMHNDSKKHASDPRMYGSSEHNMGRAAHDGHVLAWVINKMEELVEQANKPGQLKKRPWLRHWTPID